MHVVIFEVEPKRSGMNEYLDIASQLKEELEQVEGFRSLNNPEKLLSLSTWESETAIKMWRNQLSHKIAQEKGRLTLFKDYRIRVANVIRDYDFSNSPWS